MHILTGYSEYTDRSRGKVTLEYLAESIEALADCFKEKQYELSKRGSSDVISDFWAIEEKKGASWNKGRGAETYW